MGISVQDFFWGFRLGSAVWGALSRSLVVLSGSSDGAWSGLGSLGSWLEFSLGLRGAAQARSSSWPGLGNSV